MLELSFISPTKYQALTRPFFKKIIESAIKEIGLEKKQVGVSINLVSKTKIQSLNKKYRHKNKPTDVLSFPLSTLKDVKNPQNAILELGDIFICPDVAVQQVAKNEVSMNNELKFLTVHGFLHLLGYDHEVSKSEKKKMFQLQDKILKRL